MLSILATRCAGSFVLMGTTVITLGTKVVVDFIDKYVVDDDMNKLPHFCNLVCRVI